jgi:hypothetical protein
MPADGQARLTAADDEHIHMLRFGSLLVRPLVLGLHVGSWGSIRLWLRKESEGVHAVRE